MRIEPGIDNLPEKSFWLETLRKHFGQVCECNLFAVEKIGIHLSGTRAQMGRGMSVRLDARFFAAPISGDAVRTERNYGRRI